MPQRASFTCPPSSHTLYHPAVLIDNYDSSTYNLGQKSGEVDPSRPMKGFRKGKVTIDEVAELKPTHIVISPALARAGSEDGSNEVIRHASSSIARSIG
jgi:anthranilate/para-aminobenzoate synthase component II